MLVIVPTTAYNVKIVKIPQLYNSTVAKYKVFDCMLRATICLLTRQCAVQTA